MQNVIKKTCKKKKCKLLQKSKTNGRDFFSLENSLFSLHCQPASRMHSDQMVLGAPRSTNIILMKK